MKRTDDILRKVDSNRLADHLWQLVNIPSPTGNERQAALAYAQMLEAAGAEVEMEQSNYNSPCVIGRLSGVRPGKTFQLAGHIDHIEMAHQAPTRNDETISGRGAADMKAGLAGILEIVRVLAESGRDFPGKVLVTIYGLHEAPRGDSSGLLKLIEKGIMGDVAMVAENVHSTQGKAVVAGKGLGIWNITLSRQGESCHELNRPSNAEDLPETALGLVHDLLKNNRLLKAQACDDPLLGPGSLFIGQIHYGDFYNRVPTTFTIQGTRRWNPEQNFEQVREKLERLVRSQSRSENVSLKVDWSFVGDTYRLNSQEPVVRCLRSAYQTVVGSVMGLVGISAVTDANRLVACGKLPTILCNFDNRTAHADREIVNIKNLTQSSRIALLTVLNYLNAAEKGQG